MPVPRKTAAEKVVPRKTAAKKAPAKKAPSKRGAPKTITVTDAYGHNARELPRELPTPPWRSWNLPPENERDQWAWYGPDPQSDEYREFQEYVDKYRQHPDFAAAFAELRRPIPETVREQLQRAAETGNESAREVVQDMDSSVAYIQPDPGSVFALVADAQRRYQSEPPRLYVIVRQVGRERLVLGTDLFDRGVRAKWTDQLEEVQLMGSTQAAEHLRILDRQTTEVDLLGDIISYEMLPADLLLHMAQMKKQSDTTEALFLGKNLVVDPPDPVATMSLRHLHDLVTGAAEKTSGPPTFTRVG